MSFEHEGLIFSQKCSHSCEYVCFFPLYSEYLEPDDDVRVLKQTNKQKILQTDDSEFGASQIEWT